MDYDYYDRRLKKSEEHLKGCIASLMLYVVYMIVFLVVTAFFSGCTTTKVVTVEKVRTDTLYEYKLMYDSIHVHDSVHVKESLSGDTVFFNIERWHTKYIEKQITDTVYQSKCDSIPVPYEVIKEVPKKLSWWQTTFIWIGIIFSLALILYIIFSFKFFFGGSKALDSDKF